MLKKVYRKFFPAKPVAPTPYNVVKGKDCSIDPSSILVTVDKGKIILQGKNYIGRSAEIGTTGLVDIGYNTSIQDRCIILGDVEIGHYCTFAPNVYISSGRHYYDHKPNFYIKDQDALVAGDKTLSMAHSKKVTIGDDCWLGINSVIMSGVTIGRGAVIGANAVVTKDVPPFSVVGGIPAKLIKKRLELTAKTKISFDNENDLPNFYKGFFIDQQSLNETRPLKGVAAGNDFEVYLNNDAKQIAISLKKIEGAPLILTYNNQEITVNGNDFTTITFTLAKNNYHRFIIKSVIEKNRKCAIIKSVETQN